MSTETTAVDTPKSESPDLVQEAVGYLSQGKRHLVCNEIPAAVNDLQEACRLLAAQYGETADECGEVYFYYGRSLLELARMENGVLGNALDGVPDEGDDTLPKSENFENADNLPGGSSSQDEQTDEDNEEGEDAEDEKKEGEEDPDDISNLQLAWEMLELANVIFSRQDAKEMKLKVAETHNYLGEVSLETEQYEQSITEFLECLKIRKEHLETDNRQIAETHYQLGLAYLFNKQYDESVDHLKNAANCIENKLASLQKIVDSDESNKGKDIATADNPVVSAQNEIKELRDILPDIVAKIEDAEEEKRNENVMKKIALQTMQEGLGTTVGFGSPQTTTQLGTGATTSEPAAPANDITSMVRKKRKVEDVDECGDAKKAKQENGAVSNGNGANSSGISPEKKEEVAIKTVEDVQKLKDDVIEDVQKLKDDVDSKV